MGMLWLRKGELEKIIDPMLVDTIKPNSLRKFAETTEKCLKPFGSERPNMRDVVWDLEYALQLQLTPMNRGPLEDSTLMPHWNSRCCLVSIVSPPIASQLLVKKMQL